MHIHCPHCHNPIEVVEEERPEEVVCPSCGSSFRVEPGTTSGWSPKDGERKLGKFVLIDIVGVGAFGTVYMARDTELDRVVAIKVPRAGNLTSSEDLDRFLREARSVAQLRHPSIVSVHDVGQENGLPYLVSDFVRGTTLTDLLSVRRPSPREAAELIATVADALEYAHRQGVVHRDVKPSNIMLDDDGTPRLMDFGLAKRDAGEITMTLDGQVLGTPAYMSPEQAKGESHKVDGRSDVYSLGVVLYELLTGELPFRGTKRMLIYQVVHEEPRAPRSIQDNVPRDLETICLKAMAKEPKRRYAGAREFAEDLRRFLRSEPIRARRISPIERLWRWCYRKPVYASLLGALFITALALALLVTFILRTPSTPLSTFMNTEVALATRSRAFDLLPLNDRIVFSQVLSAIASERDRLSANAILSKTLSTLKTAAWTSDIHWDMVGQVFNSYQDKLELFRTFSAVAPVPQTLQIIRQQCVDPELTESLTTAMCDAVEALDLASLSNHERSATVQLLLAIIENSAHQRLVRSALLQFDSQPAAALCTWFMDAYRGAGSEIAPSASILAYARVTSPVRVRALGNAVTERLVGISETWTGDDISVDYELWYLVHTIGELQQFAPVIRFPNALTVVASLVENRSQLSDSMFLQTALLSFAKMYYENTVSLDPLRAILEDVNADPRVRAAAALALGALRDKDSRTLLENLSLNTKKGQSVLDLRVATITALHQMDTYAEEDTDAQVEVLDADVQVMVIRIYSSTLGDLSYRRARVISLPIVNLVASRVEYPIDFDLESGSGLAGLQALGEKLHNGEVHFAVVWGAEWGWLRGRLPDLEPLAVLGMGEGLSTQLLVRRTDRLPSLKELRGKRLAISRRATLFDRIFLNSLLVEGGYEPSTFFRIVEYPSAKQAYLAVLTGKADCLVSNSRTQLFMPDKVLRELARVVESEAYPPPVVIGNHERVNALRPGLWQSLRKTLITIHKTAEGRQMLRFFTFRRFVVPTPDFAFHVEEVAKRYPVELVLDP